MPKDIPLNFFSGSLPIAIVAGGAGFIGSFVCKSLLDKNIKVICVDNWQPGLNENIDEFLSNKNFLLLDQGVTKTFIKKIERVDYVLHLLDTETYLSPSSVSIESLETNSVGTKILLDTALHFNARFLLLSSVYVHNQRQFAGVNPTSFSLINGYEENKLSQSDAKRFAEALALEYGKKKNLDVRIVRTGDVYGPKMVLSTDSFLGGIFKQAIYNQQLVLPGRGEAVLFPVFVADTVLGVTKTLFSSGFKKSIATLVGEKKTLIEVARVIKETGRAVEEIAVDPSVSTELLSKSAEQIIEKERDLQKENFSWFPKTNLKEGIEETIDWFVSVNKMSTRENVENKSKTESKKIITTPIETNFWQEGVKLGNSKENIKHNFISNKEKNYGNLKLKKKKWRSIVSIFLTVTVISFFWFGILPFFQFGVGLFEFSSAKKSIMSSDLDKAKTWSEGSGLWFESSREGFLKWSAVPILNKLSARFSSKSLQFRELSGISKETVNALESAKTLFVGIGGSSSFDSTKISKELALQLKSLENTIGFLQAEVGTGDVSVKIPFGKKIVAVQEGDLSVIRTAVSGLAGVVELLPELTGRDERKVYLILFQDNSELTGAGGKIKTYGLLSFEKGHLANFEIQDVVVADSQLKGLVDPPSVLKQFAILDNWSLEDSGWDPDFPVSASRASWFINKELGQKINGVVSVNTTFIKNFTKRAGGLKIVDSNEIIAESSIDKKILDAKNKNVNYIAVLARSVATEISNDPGKMLGAFARSAVDSLSGRNIMVWTDNKSANSALVRSVWEGSVKKINCGQFHNNTKKCLSDFIYPVEENVGDNSANLFIQRTYSLDVSISEEKVKHRLTISYKNNAPQAVSTTIGSDHSLDYKNYLRLYTTTNSEISLASIVGLQNGKEESLTIDKNIQKDKTVFGTYFVIPQGESKDLVLIWETPNVEKIEDGGSLVLYWQKQAGLSVDPVSMRVNLPTDQAYKNSVYPQPSLTGEGFMGYNTFLSRDLLINIIWQPK